MKIYERVVIDMDTLETLEAEVVEYDGPLAQCGGGKGSIPDPAPPPPEPEPKKEPDKKAMESKKDARDQATKAAGLAKTKKTGPAGLLDEADTQKKELTAASKKKTLLGQ